MNKNSVLHKFAKMKQNHVIFQLELEKKSRAHHVNEIVVHLSGLWIKIRRLKMIHKWYASKDENGLQSIEYT